MKFLILNGPNLNIMRWSEPGVPGELDYNAIMDYVQAGCEQLGIETDCCQSNHEGDLVDEIQAAAGRVDGIVLNPGAYAHYSVAILDALRLCGVPAVEVMLHAPDEREPFRKTDVVSFGCQGHFIGEGPHLSGPAAAHRRLQQGAYRDVKTTLSVACGDSSPEGGAFLPRARHKTSPLGGGGIA